MNTRRLVTDAVLIALYVVLNFYTIRLGWLNISLAAFPILVAALGGRADRRRNERLYQPAFDLRSVRYHRHVDASHAGSRADGRPVRHEARF